MPDDLEERLKSHARAFDGLLSLIPAKLYYGEDNSDQWQRKKQTKEQKRAAKLAKLDPDNSKSAKDVMDERAATAKKRKREDDGEQESSTNDISTNSEKPKEGLRTEQQQKKKQNTSTNPIGQGSKGAADTSLPNAGEEQKRRKAEKQAAQKLRKQAKEQKAKAKRERQKARKAEATSNEPREAHDGMHQDSTSEVDEDNNDMAEPIDLDSTIFETEPKAASTASSSPGPDLIDIQSPHAHSASSSISSIQVPTATEIKSTPPEPSETPSAQQSKSTKLSAEEVRARLATRIEALRAARKADGPNGQPARSRQELLEARRKKEEERRAHKKELRRKAKEEEALKQDEELARRFSPGGSGSLLASPGSPMAEPNSFSFGRVAFSDGTQADSTLTSLLDPSTKKSKKGPSDPASLLKAAEFKTARLNTLDPSKRSEIEEKDMWLNARKKAHGERLKDDTSLLKKALKRQEGKKGKSEKEWAERKEGVDKGIAFRQKRREENLKNRKDGKGSGGGKKGGKSGGGGKGKGKPKVKRPGFEGSFRAKHGNNSGGGKK